MRKLLALATLALILAPLTGRADPPAIRLAWSVMPGELAPVIFASHPELAHNNGKTYAFSPVHITASPQMIQGLAANEIDIAAFAFSSFPLAVQNAGMTDLRIIADESQDGAPGYYTDESKVRNDGGIAKIEDLKGKVLATNGLGTGVHMSMTALLKRHGLEEKRDYTVIEVPFPAMTAVLKDKKADMITTTTPFIWAPELQAIGKTLFTNKDAIGTSELSFWAMRDSFIKKNRAAVVDLLEDMLRSIRWYKDPANRKEGIELIAKFMKRPPAAFEQWIFTKKDFYRDPDLLVDLGALQHNVDTMKEIGVIKESMDVKKYADLSMMKEAAARLKK